MSHMLYWSYMKTQNFRSKQVEENWNLPQYNFLAGSGRTVPPACHSNE